MVRAPLRYLLNEQESEYLPFGVCGRTKAETLHRSEIKDVQHALIRLSK